MELNSSDSYIEEFDSSDVPGRQSIFPSKPQILIYSIILMILIFFLEKLFVKIFLFFIPSYFFLILVMILINYIFLVYLVYTCIFPGKNFIVRFYLKKYYGKNRVKQFYRSLEHLKNRIDKVIKLDNKMQAEEGNEIKININFQKNNEDDTSKSKVSSKYVDIYMKIKEYYGKLNYYETDFLNKLISLKSSIEISSLQDSFKKLDKNEKISLSNKDLSDYENIKSEATILQNTLNEYKEDFPCTLDVKKIISYFKNLFFNDILSSQRFSRISILLKNQNSKEIKIETKDNINLDCLLMLSKTDNNNNNDLNNNKNLVIVCGPNLTPFESFINSWDVDTLYLDNNIDILFWNYRGYGFSEGSTNFNNICEDVLCVYDFMSENYNYKNIAVHGLSIGGIPSCFLAKNRKVKLLIADRTFGSVLDFLNSFRYLSKGLFYLAKFLRIPLIDNSKNFMEAKCKKVILNDPEDTTVIDSISLKTSIAKRIIQELFNEKYPEFNIRNIKSENILDYALEPEDGKEIFNAFKYTINFYKNKYENYYSEENYNKNEMIKINLNKEYNNDMNIKVEDSKKEQLNLNKIDNLDINNIPVETLHDISKEFYQKIYFLYSNFVSCGDYLIRFSDYINYMNNIAHFNNFFNNLFVFGVEDFLHRDDIIICNIKNVDEMLNNFITEADKFLNSKEIIKFSEYLIYKNFQFFIECVKKFKLFLLGLHLDNIENEYLKELKGELIPLNCGHILFYNDRELNTIKNIVKENLGENFENNSNNNEV